MLRSKVAAARLVALFGSFFLTPIVFGESGDSNPTGVSGAFNGNSTTAGSVDPYTGNAIRIVDDISPIPGAVGAHPLKWTRWFNSHTTFSNDGIACRWGFSYIDYRYDRSRGAILPDGRVISGKDFGVEEQIEDNYPYTDPPKLWLSDGTQIIFGNGASATKIIDPFGNETTIATTGSGATKTTKITEQAGRYLLVSYNYFPDLADPNHFEDGRISKVEAFDGVPGHLATQSVTYTWTSFDLHMPAGVVKVPTLTRADYSDGTFATYTYIEQHYLGPWVCDYPYQRDVWRAAVLNNARDVRYAGAMRDIAYVYYSGTGNSNTTRVASENHLLNGTAAEVVTGFQGVGNNSGSRLVTETRGDGAQRSFHYNDVPRDPGCTGTEPADPMPLDGKLLDYTDFRGNTMTLTYDQDDGSPHGGFITAVSDANGRATTYDRQNNSWGIKTITHVADGSTIQQRFWPPGPDQSGSEDQPYYLWKRTDELGHTTNYIRDDKNRVIRKEYPDGGWEEFDYNTFGEVTAHRRCKDSQTVETETFIYDARGLKTSSTDAAGGVTAYTYYTTENSGLWADRLKLITHPVNASGVQASETYEYDYAFDANGNQTATPAAGQGFVTKVTYADNSVPAGTSSISKVYNKYGDLLSETDELGHTTTHTYDEYGRLLSTTTPPRFTGDTQNHTITNSYVPSGASSSYITTSAQPFLTTLPSGKQTKFEYDENWRKRFVHVGFSSPDEAISEYRYDEGAGNIGHLTSTIDPRGNATRYAYDARDRQISITDALGHTTSVTFDAAGNKLTETHANGELIMFDAYDEMNRLLQKTTHRDDTTVPPTVDIVHMSYDCAGNQMTFQDENATARGDTTNIYKYDYDNLNRLSTMHYPDGKTEIHEYDAAGNVKKYTNRAGAVQHFDHIADSAGPNSYDNRNRLCYFYWANDAANTTSQTTVYDAASRKLQIDNADATINFVYYDDNKLKSQEEWSKALADNVHRIVSYTYDADGNRDSITYPSGAKFDYDYTARNQTKDIKLDGQTNPIVSYQFDLSGNITNRALNNSTYTAYTVDQVNRDTLIVHNFASGARQFEYAYNSVNDVTAVRRDSDKGDGYRYDLTQEIVEFQQDGAVDLNSGTVANPAVDNNMQFDHCGNRTQLNGENQTYNNMNQPTGGGYEHDADGNLISWNGWSYTYDAQNRLRHATNAAQAVTADFYYDGLNRQIARQITGSIASNPTPTPTPTPITLPTIPPTPTISPTPTIPPTATPTVSPSVPTISPTPTISATIPPLNTPTPIPTVPPVSTPTPTPTPPKVAALSFNPPGQNIYPANSVSVTISTTTSGCQIRYTLDGSVPTQTNGTLINGSSGSTISFYPGVNGMTLSAIAYKSGYTDSDVRSDDYWRENTGGQSPNVGGPDTPSTTVTIFSVWDGDWAILEEYAPGNVLVEKYLQGYHGLVKTFVNNVYYYQDELGSTSHVADANGALLEYYKYDLYGKPRFFDALGNQLGGSNYNVQDLFTGQRFVTQIGLYDDRNRFMSPELGRFLQPDPVGFKGDASNLYRYCGNDWANKTDPTGEYGEVYKNGTNIKVVIPIVFSPDGLAQKYGSSLKAGIEGMSGPAGKFNVRFEVTHSKLFQPYNEISLRSGNGISQTQTGGTQGTWYMGDPRGPAAVASFEAMHLVGLPDRFLKDSHGSAAHDQFGHTIPDPAGYKGAMSAVGNRLSGRDVKDIISYSKGANTFHKGEWGSIPSSAARAFGGMTYIGGGYVTNRNGGVFTNGAWQRAAGNYGAWDANHFGAPHSSPSGDDMEGAQAGVIHPVPKSLY